MILMAMIANKRPTSPPQDCNWLTCPPARTSIWKNMSLCPIALDTNTHRAEPLPTLPTILIRSPENLPFFFPPAHQGNSEPGAVIDAAELDIVFTFWAQ
ncbi:hypothetical protein J1614_007802 [Plenodomus biglobosus]|nr:hypothetical protein J1614_007802 [Plenodomus biglobosus]